MKRYILIGLTLLSAMVNAQQQQDDVVLRAMQDEMKRNMEELHEKDFDKPFFIGYSISEHRSMSVSASLGGLINAIENKERYKNVRVLVGDYDFNDESLDSDSYNPREESEIELPIDDDYYGIRRSLWATTDYVYKSAARQYKKNLETRKEKEAKGDFQFRKFSRVPVVNLVQDVKFDLLDKKKFEDLARELSGVFLEFTELDGSGVAIQATQTIQYIVTSEGTIARVPKQVYQLQMMCGLQKDNGEDIFDQASFTQHEFAALPSKEELLVLIRTMCNKLISKEEHVFEDEYTGPILFTDLAVADLFAGTLFGFRDKLMATDMIPDPKSNRKDNGMEPKIDKPVIHEQITVKTKTPLQEYKGKRVLGSYAIDDEGVQPDAELVLIENGVLKNLLNDRTLVHASHKANGHNNGPGVVEVSFAQGLTFDALRKKLLDMAKAEGLEYGIMVKSKLRGAPGSKEVVKVYVKDGHEEVVNYASIDQVMQKSLKKDVFATQDLVLHNVEGGPGGMV